MGVKARSYKIQIFLIQIAFYQVSSQLPQQITQYVLSNYGPNVNQNPALTLPPQSLPTQSLPPQALSTQPLSSLPTQLLSSLPTQSLSSLPTQSLLPNNAPSSCKSTIPKVEQNGPLDSNVLNNLAIALQLLIVSNIMNMPEPERLSKLESISKLDHKHGKPSVSYLPSISSYLDKPVYYEIGSKPYDMVSKPMYEMVPKTSYDVQPNSLLQSNSIYETLPKSKFLSSAGFSEPSFSPGVGIRKNPRSSMTLMSPYDALGTSYNALETSFGDSITTYTKQDFQSPYASILAADGNKDLFSLADLF